MGKERRSQHFADFCHPKKRIGKIAIVFLTCYAMLAVVVLNITTQNAMAQMETCPSSYYLATNNLCYPYQQQQQQQTQGTVNQSSKLSDSFKTLQDSLMQYFGRALGVEFAYNSTGVGIHVTCMKLGGPLFNYLISKVPANVSSLTIATKLEQKGLICHN